MRRATILRAGVSIAVTVLVAAVTGIATGAAAPSKDSSPSNDSSGDGATTRQKGTFEAPLPGPPPGIRGAGVAILGGPPVHAEMVVPNRKGDGFITVTEDNGKLDSVSGNSLSITEGTEDATYKQVTLDLPDSATVIRNGRKAELSDLQNGDQVHVSQSDQRTMVFALDSKHQRLFMPKRFNFRSAPMKGGMRPPNGRMLPTGPPPFGPAPRSGG